MTNKERLEEIKNRYMEREYDYALKSMDIDWLIEQAERVRKLENQLEHVQESADYCNSVLVKREEQNNRYREALEEVLKTGDYEDMQDYIDRIVTKACQALEGEE